MQVNPSTRTLAELASHQLVGDARDWHVHLPDEHEEDASKGEPGPTEFRRLPNHSGEQYD